MPSFLLALIALVSSFFQSGKPATNPPAPQEEVVTRGAEVSVLTRQEPDTTSIPAHNESSDKLMPTLVPQVAVDNSQALVEPTPTVEPEPEPLSGKAFGLSHKP